MQKEQKIEKRHANRSLSARVSRLISSGALGGSETSCELSENGSGGSIPFVRYLKNEKKMKKYTQKMKKKTTKNEKKNQNQVLFDRFS
jgi:hypothetical protein